MKNKKNTLKFDWKKVGYSLLFALLFSIIVIIPDYLLRVFAKNYVAHFHANTFLLIFCFMGSIFLVKSNKFFLTTVSLVWILMLCSLFYFFHFGRYFIGSDISLLFVETEDIFIGFVSDIFNFWYLIVMCVALFVLSIILRRATYKRVFHSNLFIITFIISLLSYPGYVVMKRLYPDQYYPSVVRYIFRNGMNSLSMYVVDSFLQKDSAPDFTPYEVKKVSDITEPITIILFMGESVSSNNMSLFGYNRQTTPNLDKLKNDKNFIAIPAISASVRTGSSLPLFFNLQKEAQNTAVTNEGYANLLKLAKSQGFHTSIYSPQSSITFAQIGMQYMDNVVYRDNARKEYKERADEYTLDLLKSTELKDKNFIFIQTRAVHFPYKNIYNNMPEYNVFDDKDLDTRINEYDNAMLYFDNFLSRMLDWAKGIDGKVYFIMTSDHGQMLGQNDKWGHSFLNKIISEVPFFIYTKGVSQKNPWGGVYGQDNIPPKLITHYDIGKLIAKILGYEIINPNTPDNVYYINGTDITGNAGFIKYKIENGKFIELN